MKHKRFPALLLFFLVPALLLTAMTGCGKNSGSKPPAVTVDPGQAENDLLPQKDMEGFELTFLNYTDAAHGFSYKTICTDDITDAVNKAIYSRNLYVETRYHAVISETQTGTMIDTLTKAAMADTDETFQIAMVFDQKVNTAYVNGLLSTWDRLEYCDFSKPWWNSDACEGFSMNGSTYGAVGEFSLSMYSKNYCYFFNKLMYATVDGSDDVYELVRNKQWTLDKMLELAETYTTDLDGDGMWYDGTDQYGIAGTVKVHYQLVLTGSGMKFVEPDGNGTPQFVLDRADRIAKLSAIIDKFNDTTCYYDNNASDPNGGIVSKDFLNGHVLFFAGTVWNLSAYQESEIHIGILPAPMYNGEQAEYCSVAVGGTVACVSKALREEDAENTGLLIEAMCSYSHDKVLPVYRDNVLKSRYSNAPEDAEMLQLIFDTTVFDLGTTVWNLEIRTPIMSDLFSDLNSNVASYVTSLATTAKAAIEKSLGKQ